MLQGRDRLARAVEDHVGRIEVDEQIVAADVAEELQQRVGRLLAGLQVQVLAVGLAVVAQLAGDGDDVAVQRVGRVVRHEAEVQAHGVDAQQPGEIGDLLHLLQPRGAGRRRHQADGARDGGNVGVALALEAAEDDA